MRTRSIALVAVLMLAASACGSSDSEPEGASSDTRAQTATTVANSGSGEDTASTGDTSAPVDTTVAADTSPTDGPSATLTLDNGESFTFGILCALEPQIAADQEILFVVASYDNPYNLDVTQFGADSFGGAANISLYDSASYDTVWEASSLYGGEIELDLNGNTVTGSGMFFPGGDPAGEGVQGDLVANC